MERLKMDAAGATQRGDALKPDLAIYLTIGIALLEQFNPPGIQTVARGDDLHLAGLHARRDDRASALQAFSDIACVRTNGIIDPIPRFAFQLFDAWQHRFYTARNVSSLSSS